MTRVAKSRPLFAEFGVRILALFFDFIIAVFAATALNDHVLMPGLINAHAHTPMNLFRGLADDLALMDWLNHHIWPAEKALINEESVAVGSRLAIAEMLGECLFCAAAISPSSRQSLAHGVGHSFTCFDNAI